MSKAICLGYLRVSTAEQGDSRLGLKGQHLAIADYAQRHGYEITEWHEEVASAKGHTLDHRPVLREVLTTARKRRCRVLVAKLDRLSRDVHFVTGLMAERVAFRSSKTASAWWPTSISSAISTTTTTSNAT